MDVRGSSRVSEGKEIVSVRAQGVDGRSPYWAVIAKALRCTAHEPEAVPRVGRGVRIAEIRSPRDELRIAHKVYCRWVQKSPCHRAQLRGWHWIEW